MAQDLRDILKKGDHTPESKLREGHLSRFEDALDAAIPEVTIDNTPSKKWGGYFWLKIAAAVVIAGGIMFMIANNASAKIGPETIVSVEGQDETTEEKPAISLSAIAPEFKKVEDKYLANINIELSRLEITDDNQDLVDSFLMELQNLDSEYKRLNQEIVETGISEEMVDAMLDNLKLRVELLMKLKVKLNELKVNAKQQNTIQTI